MSKEVRRTARFLDGAVALVIGDRSSLKLQHTPQIALPRIIR